MTDDNDDIVRQYIERRPLSARLHAEALMHFGAGGATHAARVSDPFRPYITHAEGSRKWDVDGNEYVDYTMGHGALLLGHSHPAIVEAIQVQAAKGLHYGENHEMEIRWASLISSMMPVAERIEFCAAGQEANMMAVRLARAYTGRRRILRFAENYHGWADELAGPGPVGCLAEEVTVLPFNDREAVEKALATREYAIMLSEGGGGHMAGQVPIELALQRDLPGMARQYGTLYCLDEVVTGFRDAPGGWQELVGVKPDLSTIGKCVGGGVHVGAVVGREDIFSALSPAAPPGARVIHAGTWNANPLAAAAGVAACTLYLNGAPERQAAAMARRFRDGGNEVFRRLGIQGRFYSRSIVHLYLGPVEQEPATFDFEGPSTDVTRLMAPEYEAVKTRLGLHLLEEGVAAFRGAMYVFSSAHTEQDVDFTIEALETSLIAMRNEGSFPQELVA
ncbi:MAG: aspartate aminotransferase family protein [Chloroflexota bacterium]